MIKYCVTLYERGKKLTYQFDTSDELATYLADKSQLDIVEEWMEWVE